MEMKCEAIPCEMALFIGCHRCRRCRRQRVGSVLCVLPLCPSAYKQCHTWIHDAVNANALHCTKCVRRRTQRPLYLFIRAK